MGALTGGFGTWGCCSHQFRVGDPAGLGCLTVSHLHGQSNKLCPISERKHLALLRELWPKDISKGINLKCESSWQVPALDTILLDAGKTGNHLSWATEELGSGRWSDTGSAHTGSFSSPPFSSQLFHISGAPFQSQECQALLCVLEKP